MVTGTEHYADYKDPILSNQLQFYQKKKEIAKDSQRRDSKRVTDLPSGPKDELGAEKDLL